ncbi:MAG TPA: DNA cytosine methyltransferase [Patescibacteria group bacterium]|nr:DNA cytosine methyltransferase [Patescibacteria group bacterium]
MIETNKIKMLNLYCGIGGNRKLLPENIEVTAVEIDPKIAKIYQDFFPNDKVIIADAHQYLLEHYNEFDFIWSSPPCPSHSRVRFANQIQNKPIYPSMILYEEIIFLQNYFIGKWVVENVISYYDPLIKPQIVGKHYYWANFILNQISRIENKGRGMGKYENLKDLYKLKGFDLTNYNGIDKMKTIRNCVEPELGLHIFKCAFKEKQGVL